ncbi:hypothetical protein [Ensifer sp. WSM1721]|uniref:hypothetical protein n=1 Tax=Ensifer sp. WSM1721 TaxID=1041159 RepID=UPI001FDA4053|nr:hypothetical protein [Ensifer sp. WSM1721]
MSDLAQRQRNLLFAALELYRALGGSFEQLEASIMEDATGAPRRVDVIIGDLMNELAAISHMHDMDLMQAAHNTLDIRLREIRAVLATDGT